MTAFSIALAQLEGLSRLDELPVDSSPSLSQACAEALATSRAAAAEAQANVEAQVRAVGGVQCSGASDVRLRDALMQHGKQLLEDLKPRFKAVTVRTEIVARSASFPVRCEAASRHTVPLRQN